MRAPSAKALTAEFRNLSADEANDRDRDRLFISSWGDIAEKHPEWERDHATIRRGTTSRSGGGTKSRAQLDCEIAEIVGPSGKREVTERDWGSPAWKRRMRSAGWKI